MRSQRVSDIAAVIAALAIVGGLGYALRPQEVHTVSADSHTAAAVSRPQLIEDPARPTVLFIGDSYTAGSGLSEMSPSCRAAREMHWLCRLSAVPGTGYISGGSANRFTVDPYTGQSTSMAERIPHLGAIYAPDIVVLDGGRNDAFPPRDDVFKAVVATIAETRRTWPAATLVFVRPRHLNRPDDDLGFDDEFMARLQTQPAAKEMVIIDPIALFTSKNTSGMLLEDREHPNQQGEQQLTTALVDSLLNRGFAVAT